MKKRKYIGIIPARYSSTRFPGKPLVMLLGKPMILWVAELSSKALGKDNIVVATESTKIKSVVEAAGFKAIITSEKHETGTDRLAEVAASIDAEVYINIQGDEPTLDPKTILQVVEEKDKNPDCVINAMAKLSNVENPKNINIPKVIANESNDMVYMSRNVIPGFKTLQNKPKYYYKQICVYAFSKNHLLKFNSHGRKGTLETSEDIEILRFLDLAIPVKMTLVSQESYAVDVPDDILLVENRLRELHHLV
jgi:3-deoxy-manno-octulosonate cytidylyltransferase (CMP-KDO synthetase)